MLASDGGTPQRPCSGSLPFELRAEILAHLEDERNAHHAPWYFTKTVLQPTLSGACLVSRDWNEAATALLYKDVLVAFTQSLTRLSLTLTIREDVRQHVRSLFFTRFYEDSSGDFVDLSDRQSDALQNIYRICPNLHSETLDADATPYTSPSKRTGLALFRSKRRHRTYIAHLHPLRTGTLPVASLTHLSLQSIHQPPNAYIPASLVLPALQDLTLRNFGFHDTDPAKMAWPTMPQLQRLCLVECLFYSPGPYFAPGPLSPRAALRVLEIVGGQYLGGVFWENLVRGGRALEQLTFAPRYVSRPACTAVFAPLAALAALRICSSCCAFSSADVGGHLTTGLVLPPALVHLVLLESPDLSFTLVEPPLRDTLQCAMRIVEKKRAGLACPRLRTLRIRTREKHGAESLFALRDSLARLAESAGIEVSVDFVGRKRASGKCESALRMLRSLSPFS